MTFPLHQVANRARGQNMGLYSSGPFTRVDFFLQRGKLELMSGPAESSGTLVHTISGYEGYLSDRRIRRIV